MLHLLNNVKEMDISELLDYIRKMKEENLDIYECLDFMQLWYRDVLLYKVARDMNQLIFKDEYSSINEIGQKCSYEGLEKIFRGHRQSACPSGRECKYGTGHGADASGNERAD